MCNKDFDTSIVLAENAMLKVRPDLWDEWDFKKNEGIDIYSVTKGQNIKVWWKCNKGHEWQYIVNNRISQNSNCPICKKKVYLVKNNLLLKNPELCKEWDYEKNLISPSEITYSSSEKLWWICSKCKSSYDSKLNNRKKGHGCPYCRGLRVNETNSLASLYPDIAKEWDYEKNGDLTPHKVTCGKNQVVWWLCENGHNYQSTINSRVGSENRNGTGCGYCSGKYTWIGFNDLNTTNIEMSRLLLNKEDGYKYSEGSKQRLDWKCPTCKTVIINKRIIDVKNEGLKCSNCSDTKKYPERFMNFLLRQLEVEFKWDESMSWSNRKRYDFYLEFNGLKILIECHGQQHYEHGFEDIGGMSLEENQANDQYKYELALKNGIDKYIVIDCRYSKFEYIKRNILQSEMDGLFDLSNVNWEDINLKLNRTLIENVANEWNNEKKSSKDISTIYKITIKKTRSILEKATDLKLCNYDKWEDCYYKKFNVLKLDNSFNVLDMYFNKDDAFSKNKIKMISINSVNKSGGYYWCYQIDYEKFKNKILDNKEIMKIEKEKRIRSIVQIDLNGKVIKTWHKGKKEILGAHPDYVDSALGNSLSRSQGTYKNYIWLYKEFYDTKEGKDYVNSLIGNGFTGTKKRVILKIDTATGEVLEKFDSIVDVINKGGVNKSMINKVLNKEKLTTYGFIWMREREYETEEGKKFLEELLHRIKKYKAKFASYNK